MRKYDYVAWKDEGLWTAHSPSVPGVYGLGATRRAAETDLIDATAELLDYLDDVGENPPKRTRVVAGTIEVG